MNHESAGKFMESLDVECHGMTTEEALAKGICISCKKPPTFYSEAGRREYPISALCEPCFDRITAEPEGE